MTKSSRSTVICKDAVLVTDIWDNRILDNVEYKMVNPSINDVLTDYYSAESSDYCSLASIRIISESSEKSSSIIILKISHSREIRLKLISKGDIFCKETSNDGQTLTIRRKPGATSINKFVGIDTIILKKDSQEITLTK